MTTNSFPWGEVVSNAVWICGLAVILAALGWHDYKRRELKERNLTAVATTKAEPLIKPVLLGLIMVTGGLALSVRGAFPAAALATAGFALAFIFIKKYFFGLDKRM
jgi:tellurite resistance protein TehA-like permease